MTARNGKRSVAVFDLGGVVIDWNPRYLYRKLFNGDDAAMEEFLATICSSDWNLQQDAGRSWADATALLCGHHPAKRPLIEAYRGRWDEMMRGPIDGTVAILAELRERGAPLYALTNWSAETYPLAEARFEFLTWFRGVVVSGREKLVKPDLRIYRLLCERYGVDPATAVYIDDNARNAEAATELGMLGLHFTGPTALRRDLETAGLL